MSLFFFFFFTSSRKVRAPYLSARSQILAIGAMEPHMEYTDSNAITLGTAGSASRSN